MRRCGGTMLRRRAAAPPPPWYMCGAGRQLRRAAPIAAGARRRGGRGGPPRAPSAPSLQLSCHRRESTLLEAVSVRSESIPVQWPQRVGIRRRVASGSGALECTHTQKATRSQRSPALWGAAGRSTRLHLGTRCTLVLCHHITCRSNATVGVRSERHCTPDARLINRPPTQEPSSCRPSCAGAPPRVSGRRRRSQSASVQVAHTHAAPTFYSTSSACD